MAKVLKNQHQSRQQNKRYSLKPNAALPPQAIVAMRPAPPVNSQLPSLLQYGEPVFVNKPQSTEAADARNQSSHAGGTSTARLPAKHSAQPLLANLPDSKQATQPLPSDLIDILLPPRQWTSPDGTTWTQPVSRDQSSRRDVLALNEMLDIELENNSARDTVPRVGHTSLKTDGETDFFTHKTAGTDECIRQITLEMPERGVLLWRIKKEFEKNVTAFAALLESSQAFGIRKTVLSKHGQPELAARLADLQTDKQRLQNELNHLKQQFEAIDKRNVEQRAQAEKLHQDEATMFRRVNQQLKNQIEGIVKPKDAGAQDKSA